MPRLKAAVLETGWRLCLGSAIRYIHGNLRLERVGGHTARYREN